MKSLLNDTRSWLEVKLKENKLTDDSSKNLAIRIITYNQILHCYHHIYEKDIYTGLTSEQAADKEMIEHRVRKILQPAYHMKDDGEISEEEELIKNTLMAYFVSYSGNKFIETSKMYYPKWYHADEYRLGRNVAFLSRGLMKPGVHGFRHYAQLGWMYNQLPRTSDAYDQCIRFYYFSVCSCREVTYKDGK